MFAGNYESGRASCFIGEFFVEHVVQADGFTWASERGKAGFIATRPGSLLRIRLDTTVPGSAPNATVQLDLMYLQSYEHMVGCRALWRSWGCRQQTYSGVGFGTRLRLHRSSNVMSRPRARES
jgi:hypothetical protein